MIKDNLEKVVQHGRRADFIVKNMLLHSREGSGERRPVDINALVGESLNLAYHGARAEKQEFQIRLEQDLDPAAGEVELLPQEITRVLLNLISNGFYAAIKRKAEDDLNGYEPALMAATRDLATTLKSGSAIAAAASRPTCGRRCSTLSSPPSRPAKAPVSGFPELRHRGQATRRNHRGRHPTRQVH